MVIGSILGVIKSNLLDAQAICAVYLIEAVKSGGECTVKGWVDVHGLKLWK
jgi:hypothetical protein